MTGKKTLSDRRAHQARRRNGLKHKMLWGGFSPISVGFTSLSGLTDVQGFGRDSPSPVETVEVLVRF
ncbi:hypothetical protein PXK47_21370 [Phaeobacter gallaeciensis]|nr:hypothetical protein [Phaeobacter gallaeciensis]